jgi:hypothetical protein
MALPPYKIHEIYQAVQKLLGGGHRQTGDVISLLSFFDNTVIEL